MPGTEDVLVAENRGADALISVVVPMYNEEPVARETVARLTGVMDKMGAPYELVFIDDGSKDETVSILIEEKKKNPHVRVLKFSRNFGHQLAITAGMDHALGEAVITIDGDLQDPPELIPELVAKWREGFDVVYAKRRKRAGETTMKKWTAAIYYRLLRKLTNMEIPIDTGDFRLISKRANVALSRVREHHRYLRGLVTWIGFKQTMVEYDRDKRFAGTASYRLAQSIRLSIHGITSFSAVPLRMATFLGVASAVLGLLVAVWLLIAKLALHQPDLGWLAVIVGILFVGGLQMFCVGVAGEYIGMLHEEAKERPLYFISDIY